MMKRLILAGLFLFSTALLSEEEITIEEVKIDTNLEKAEAELDHMKEKVDFYQRVVRSIQREEEELKALKKMRVRK